MQRTSRRVNPSHLKNVTELLQASGYEITTTKDTMTIMHGASAAKGFHLLCAAAKTARV